MDISHAQAMISTHKLAKTYGSRWNRKEAVRGIDLQVDRGEIFGLVGPDGAGKTTTIQMLCGILSPSAGEANVAGVNVVKNPQGLGGKIGYMSESFSLYGSLSVEENLDFFARLYTVPPEVAGERKERLLRFARLDSARNRRAEHLSGGMKKKLALACSLMYAPEVLFLDEPTTGVDPVSRRDFWLLLNDFLEQGLTIFVTTPYMDEAERFNRVAFMYQGEIVACDKPAALKTNLQGDLLDLLAKPQRQAVQALRRHPRASHVQVFGERLHLLVEQKERDLPVLEADLGAANIHLSETRRITPGLEDVFVAMLEQRASNGSKPVYENEAVIVQPAEGRPANAAQGKPTAVSVSSLTKIFGSGASSFTAVNGISFDVPEGEIYGFLGPNGSGKTTTIRMLCGLLPATSGTGTVAGHDILSEQERIKPDIGYMSQKFSLYKDLTVEENLDFYAGVYSLPARSWKSRKEWALKMAGLVGRERTPVQALSGGWKQRLALSCSILHEPRVLFLDEPTSGVDPISRRAFWDLIYELAGRGVTVFITTHYMDEAEHCHELGLVYNGRIIAHGSPAELRANMHAGDMLEVTCPEPLRSIQVIRKLDGVLGAGLFGDRVHVLVEAADRLAPEIESTLTSIGHPSISVNPIPFSLEDLFVVFIEMEEKGRKP